MFQLTRPVTNSTKPDAQNKMPNLQNKVRTFKDDLENFEKGNPRDNFYSNKPPEPISPPNPFQSVPMPPPLHSEQNVPLIEPDSTPGPSEINNSYLERPPLPSPSRDTTAIPSLAKKIPPITQSAPLEGKKPKGRLISISIFFIILAASVGGAYFYWPSLKDKLYSWMPVLDSASQDISSQLNTALLNEIQNKKMKRLVVETSLGPTEIKNAVQKFVADFSATASENDLVELKILTRENNAIGKKDFLKGFGLTIPDGVVGKLSEDFSLFVKKEKGGAKLGLAFKTVTSANLASEMRNWEPSIVGDLGSLFPSQAPSTDSATFNSSQYRSADIRYLNLSSPANSSLDYSIVSNFLIIGTSKDSLRSILDYMSEK